MLADADGLGIGEILCLGDVVGYGADPGPVLDTLADRASRVAAGNHDHGVAGRLDLEWFNPVARRAAEWTSGQLSPGQLRYLGELPLRVEIPGAVLVHASPDEPGQWRYIVSAEAGAEAFAHFQTPLCFIGHSHVPALWTLRGDGRVSHRRGAGRVTLDRQSRYLVNVGSVGQPRDGDPLAAYAVWDADTAWVEIRRVPYDVRAARARIHRAGLPRILGDRLLDGR